MMGTCRRCHLTDDEDRMEKRGIRHWRHPTQEGCDARAAYYQKLKDDFEKSEDLKQREGESPVDHYLRYQKAQKKNKRKERIADV